MPLAYPGLIELTGAVFRLVQPSLMVARAVIIAFALLYVLLVALTGRMLAAWTAGLAAAALLLLDRGFFDTAGLAVSEVPALALIAVTVALAFLYWRSGRWAILGAAGFVCGLSVLVKPMAFLLPVWLGAMVAAHQLYPARGQTSLRWRSLLAGAALAAGLFLLPIAACLVIYGPGVFVQEAVSVRVGLRQAAHWTPTANWGLIWSYLWSCRAAGVLALAGLFTLDPRRTQEFRAQMLIWLLGALTLAGLWWYAPLFDRHCIVLSLPLVLLAGTSVDRWARRVSPGLRRKSPAWGAATAITLAAAVLIVTGLPGLVAWRSDPARFRQGGREEAGQRLLQQITSPHELVVSDDLSLVFTLGRLSPPELSDVSLARILAYDMTSEGVIATTEERDIQTVCLWTDRFAWLKPFVDWADAHFVSTTDFGGNARILHGRRYEAGERVPGVPLGDDTHIGESIALVGYRAEPDVWQPGDVGRIVLYWRALKPMSKDYQVFIHLADENGVPVVQGDGAPVHALYPTSRWQPEETLADSHGLTLPAGMPAGQYRLLVGMYDASSMRRLAATRDGTPVQDGTIELCTITVRGKP